jgi:hypothetical protein
MFYQKNVGTKERLARFVGGGLIVACSLHLVGFTPLGWVLAASGVVTVLTGLIGFCPACAMVSRCSVGGRR